VGSIDRSLSPRGTPGPQKHGHCLSTDCQPGKAQQLGQSIVGLLGRTASIRQLMADIDCAARCDAKVLITGETGVGKEVVARLIHHRSRRGSTRLVAINCAGLQDSLLESELFGHVRGSFTGAYQDKPGLLEMAPHGTVFMDEVGEMSTRMQALLLRFLETGEIQRVGATRAHARVDVRLIAATNRDLQAQIASRTFREDLYFRLNVIRLTVPPLRDRPEDIPLFVDHYLSMYSEQHATKRPRISPAAMDALMTHLWPGNVRELKNLIERLVLRADGDTIWLDGLPAEMLPVTQAVEPMRPAASIQNGPLTDELAERMIRGGESFWRVVYPAFMARHLTCADVQAIVRRGLEQTNGNYRSLVELFNMLPTDYRRFLTFLRTHECHLPFQPFRVPPVHGVL
jgi:transcriptional regulator with PAS, ATPase and Fis domain